MCAALQDAAVGDPTILGWITTACYFVAAFLSVRAAHAPGDGDDSITERRLRLFWCVAALLLILLGVNKQLDLQTLLTEVGRRFVRAHGWYHSKRELQAWFVVSVAALGAASVLLLAFWVRAVFWRVALALFGVVSLICFVALRASSFHDVDLFLCRPVGPMRLIHALELGGIGCVGVSAALYGRRAKTARRSPETDCVGGRRVDDE